MKITYICYIHTHIYIYLFIYLFIFVFCVYEYLYIYIYIYIYIDILYIYYCIYTIVYILLYIYVYIYIYMYFVTSLHRGVTCFSFPKFTWKIGRATCLGNSFPFVFYFWFPAFCFSAFPCFFASPHFPAGLLLCFSAFSCFPAFLLPGFSAFLIFCFSAVLFLCLSASLLLIFLLYTYAYTSRKSVPISRKMRKLHHSHVHALAS